MSQMNQSGIKHVMVDIETLATCTNAAIVSVGACSFTLDDSCVSMFEMHVSYDGLNKTHRVVDQDTLDWWSKASPEATLSLLYVLCPPSGYGWKVQPLERVLGNFTEWIGAQNPNYIWGKPAHFDIAILDSAFDACGVAAPWGHRSVRCQRTLWSTAEMLGYTEPATKSEHPHNALSDAKAQALDVYKVLNWMKEQGVK